MNRRTIGVALLVAVAITATIVPGVIGHQVSGSPAPEPIPPAPGVGTCLTAVSPPPPATEDTNPSARITYPSAEFGSCDGAVVGEVMSVDLTEHPLAKATIGTYQAASATCELDQVNYVGSIGPFDPATITTPGIAWQADVSIASVSIGPTALQIAGGQSWIACVGAARDRTAYRGRLQGALSGGVLPSTFATCWRSLAETDSSEIDDRELTCAGPHSIEVIAETEIIGPDVDPGRINSTCLGMASRALRTDDPTRGGLLQIAAYALDDRAAVLVGSNPRTGGFACIASVAEPHRLTGTVIGIGSKPLPISG